MGVLRQHLRSSVKTSALRREQEAAAPATLQLVEIDEVYLQAESQVIQSAKQRVEDQLSKIAAPTALPSATELRRAAQLVGEWLSDAEGDDFDLLLQALSVLCPPGGG